MIEILNRQKKFRIDLGRFERLLKKLVRHYGLNRPEIALSFVDDPEIRELNRKFRKRDKPTDVLSFPLNEKASDGRFYLGDIIIAVPTASAQATELSHGLESELEYLAIHGFLHLLGYEHGQGHEEEEAAIRRLMVKGR
ncbi:MAG: rRNA maturation RNase YbeY [Candidatus Aminicenantes bacterium]|nr:rRNA maturation RNase YbeY [Candidatus Aminicenantes bacterium]